MPQFIPGQSGNPAGRPRGSRNKHMQMVEEIMQEGLALAARKLVEMAKSGHMGAIKFIITWFARGRAIEVDLGELSTPLEIADAHLHNIRAAASNEVAIDDAAAFSRMLTAAGQAYERAEMAPRVAACEDKLDKSGALNKPRPDLEADDDEASAVDGDADEDSASEPADKSSASDPPDADDASAPGSKRIALARAALMLERVASRSEPHSEEYLKTLVGNLAELEHRCQACGLGTDEAIAIWDEGETLPDRITEILASLFFGRANGADSLGLKSPVAKPETAHRVAPQAEKPVPPAASPPPPLAKKPAWGSLEGFVPDYLLRSRDPKDEQLLNQIVARHADVEEAARKAGMKVADVVEKAARGETLPEGVAAAFFNLGEVLSQAVRNG